MSYIVFDVETIPNGSLLSTTKYPDLDPDAAIAAAQKDAEDKGYSIIPVPFHTPVAICAAIVDDDFNLKKFIALDRPHFDLGSMIKSFWQLYDRQVKDERSVTFVTFAGRIFDFPVLELSAFRCGLTIPSEYWLTKGPRHRFGGGHIDLSDFFTNSGCFRFVGGLDVLAQMLGRSGKQSMDGSKVYDLYKQGKTKQIVQYCLKDVMDTYAVFLRSRIMTGQLVEGHDAKCLRTAEKVLSDASAT